MRRVAITGVGAISPLGLNARAGYESACAGKDTIGELVLTEQAHYERPLRQKIAAQIADFDPDEHFTENELVFYDRSTQLCLVAAREAVNEAGISFDGGLAGRTAVVVGTGVGGISTIDVNAGRLYREDRNRVHPFSVPRIMPSAGASQISMAYGITGPSFTITSACSSAAHAIGEAYLMIRHGRVDAALTGGGEAPFCFGCMIAWQALRVMSNDACRPFSANRSGMVLGEGAGIFVLEEMEAAKARGATIIAEIAGYGLSSDAGDIVEPSTEGCAAAIRHCIEDAGIAPADVGYINAHGTATRANDTNETNALRAVFGPALDDVWVSSTKSMHGHALGGTAAIEFALTVQALTGGVLPPTINLDEVDPQCDLRHVANEAVEAQCEVALSNSFAFGGLNAVLAVRRVH